MKIRDIFDLMGCSVNREVEVLSNESDLPKVIESFKLYKIKDTGFYYMSYKDVYLKAQSLQELIQMYCNQYVVDKINAIEKSVNEIIHFINTTLVKKEEVKSEDTPENTKTEESNESDESK